MRTTRRVLGTPKGTTDEAARRQLVEQVAGAIVSVGAEARSLKSASDELGALADKADGQAQTVAAASEQTSSVMDNVAGAAEELSSSLREVSQRTSQTAAVVEQAVADTGEAQNTMASLDSSCQAIQEVSRMIASVARQTNLLALNATIEAARAGTAGRGFAVVAGEVKELSTQTATATEQIDKNVRVLMDDAQRSARSISGIATAVRQIGDMAIEVAAAVEEQSRVTAEIARNVAEAASSSGEVAQAISTLNQAVADTGDRARGVRRLTHRLLDGSAELNASLSGYLKGEIREQKVAGTSTAERLKAGVAAHGAWKARLMEAAVTGVATFDPAVVGSDDKCPLGVWLYQECTPQERQSSNYERVRETHTRFHELAGRILQQAVGGRRREAEEAVAFGGPLDSLSADLVGLINGWRDELDAA